MPAKKERKIFHKLVSIEEAIGTVEREATAAGCTEKVAVTEAGRRVLARSVFSGIDLPPFDRAEMDGYVVISKDLEGANDQSPVKLKIVGEVRAGENTGREVRKGECVEVGTGAPVPRGGDAVVMVEYTERSGPFVKVYRPTTPGENVASAGSDAQVGEMILREGAIIGTREAGVLSAAGVVKIEVVKKPIVGIISTGDELVDPGNRLLPGKIYDANSSFLMLAVEEAGGEARYIGKVGDDYRKVKEAIAMGVAESDLLTISGGTSAGAGDLVYRVLGECRPGILVHGLNVKPGKPTIVAVHDGKPIFGLPGYPVSALMIFDQVVRPYLERLGRRPVSAKEVLRAKLAERVNAAKGKRWFLPVHVISSGKEGNAAYPIISSSGAIGTLAKSDGYIVVPEDAEFLDAGEEVEVFSFAGRVEPDLVVMGSHCPGVDILLDMLFRKYGIRCKTANVGSMGGLKSVVRGEADIAGMHLLDEGTMEYNFPYVKREGLPKGSLVKGYRRLQGIMVSKGNPKKIRGLEDLLRNDIVFVNRNRGSGTRILVDHYLAGIAKKRGEAPKKLVERIKGYNWEAKTHSAVGAAIHQARADIGVGVKSVAANYGLDFIPMEYEEYDFLVNPASRGKPAIKRFLECLTSQEFRDLLKKLPGYKVG
jgi:putative molybdopterin biosynthesis protein